MKIHLMPQRSPEWFEVRDLKLTASHAQEIANAGKGLNTYVTKIIGEHFSKGKEEKYINKDMERGNNLEDEAITIYELETGHKVKKVGFIELDENTGCSPDGLVDDDGGIEVKNHNVKEFTDIVLNDEIDSKYKWQIYMNLFITRRSWWDYVGYCPLMPKSIFIKRIYPDQEVFDKLAKGIQIGSLKLNEFKAKMDAFIGAK